MMTIVSLSRLRITLFSLFFFFFLIIIFFNEVNITPARYLEIYEDVLDHNVVETGVETRTFYFVFAIFPLEKLKANTFLKIITQVRMSFPVSCRTSNVWLTT